MFRHKPIASIISTLLVATTAVAASAGERPPARRRCHNRS